MSDKPKKKASNPSHLAKKEEFVALYLGGPLSMRGNAFACYMHCYPKSTEGTARRRSYDYYHHPDTQKLLKEARNKTLKRAQLKQDKIVDELKKLSFYDFRDLFDENGKPLDPAMLNDQIAAAVSAIDVSIQQDETVTYKYKLADKNPAIDKLMRHLGMFEKDNEQSNSSLAEALKAGLARVKEIDASSE